MIQTDKDINRLIKALQHAFGDRQPERTFDSWSAPAINVLDCVLSLNRKYYSFCEPRLICFAEAHPEVQTVAHLIELIGKYSSPLAFSIKELNYRDKKRAATLIGVLTYLKQAQNAFGGKTETKRLQKWAVSVTPDDYRTPMVRGFGLAGFQYLRMLFGAQTVKPDVYVCRFVSDALGRKVRDTLALTLLEIAAKRLNWPLLALDKEIWELGAKSGKL